MDFDASLKFAADLADSLRTHCQKHLQFDSWIVVTGSLCLRVDTGQKVNLNVDQKITKQSKKSAVISFSVPKAMLDRKMSAEMSTNDSMSAASDTVNDPVDRKDEETDRISDFSPMEIDGEYD